jgi:SAM-dependent methyltransferase
MSEMITDKMRADWDRRAAEDAYFYVAFAERKQSREAFLATAAENLGVFEADLARLPAGEKRALEVGCGPGRLMLPMSRHFSEIHGVDISGEMVKLARENLSEVPHAHVQQTEGSDLRMFSADFFDFVYSYAVFQHIPSREVVLSYLREIARVLKPGGISCVQLRGAAPLPSEITSQPPTWTGCYFNWDDVRAFVQEQALQLVWISGLDTQYMVVTVRKADSSEGSGPSGSCVIGAVTPASGGGSSVPQTGRGAAVALWLDRLPAGLSLLDLEVRCNGKPGFPCYVSPRMGEAGYQVNALLPKGIGAGTAKIEVLFRGVSASAPAQIEVTPTPELKPAIVGVADGLDLASRSVRSGAMKVTMDNVAKPSEVRFHVDGLPVRALEFVCVDPLASSYEFAFLLPALPAGTHTLTTHMETAELPPTEIAIEKTAE